MKTSENGTSGEVRGQAVGGPREPEKALAPFWLSPERRLFISTLLLGVCFLSHIIFLLLVEPWRYLSIAKEYAMMYSGIPLCIGVALLVAAIYSFTKIKNRSALHIIVLVFAAVFGSLSLQGLGGIVMHLAQVTSHRV